MGRPKKQKGPEPESESEEEVEVDEVSEEDEDEMFEYPQMSEQNEEVYNEQLLEMIKAKAEESQEEGQKLTWNAVYALKEKEVALNKQMNEEMEAIRNRYRLLKQPVYAQISDVVLGKKVDKQLYNPEGLPKAGDPSKVTPRAIEDFWGEVLEKEGLLSEQVDVGVFDSVREFICEVIEPKNSHFRLVFSFNSNQYFTNERLESEYYFDEEKNEPVRDIKEAISYKDASKKVHHSLFTTLFDAETQIGMAYNVASDVCETYSNALFTYFREDEGDDEEENEEEGAEEEEDDSQVEEVQKPKKKNKIDPKNNEKPECKQQ